MKRNLMFLPALLITGLFVVGCGTSGGTNNTNTGFQCNGTCDPGQTCGVPFNCNDCCVNCDLETISGTAHDFLVAELFIPDSAASARENGVDLDGDGKVDNKLGQILSLVASQGGDFNINESVNKEIEEGSLLLVGRLFVDQWGTDDEVLAQVLQAVVVNDATPVFQGSDTVALNPDTPQDLYLCGMLINNNLQAGPDNLRIVFPIPEIGNLDLTLARAQLIGRTTAAGWEDVIIGGGLSKNEIETKVYPLVLDFLNDEIAADPTGSMASTVLDLLDDNCEPTIEGCDPKPAGCAEDTVIHVDELRCNALLNTALAPDVDLSGDGNKDHISLGLKIVRAVPVTVQD